MGIPASQRLRQQSDFQQVRRSEHRIHCGPFVVQCELACVDNTSLPKLGVIASRRVGNAVKRNRGKRLVREIFRRQAPGLPRASRYVVVLRSGFDRYAFSDLEGCFCKACTKIQRRAGAEGRDK
jgi:ribonuclease P protein component